jgi:hypothetical protein
MAEKKMYQTPVIEDWGAVTDLTATGKTKPGDDGKGGSASSKGV